MCFFPFSSCLLFSDLSDLSLFLSLSFSFSGTTISGEVRGGPQKGGGRSGGEGGGSCLIIGAGIEISTGGISAGCSAGSSSSSSISPSSKSSSSIFSVSSCEVLLFNDSDNK